MENAEYANIFLRWIHLASFAILFGGSIFMRFVLMPAAHSVLSEEERKKLHPVIMKRWKIFVHSALLGLFLSGGHFIAFKILNMQLPKPYHMVFGIKFLIAMAVFTLAVLLTAKSGFEAIRNNSKKWLTVNIVLASIIIILSGVLRFTPEVPKVNVETEKQKQVVPEEDPTTTETKSDSENQPDQIKE